MRNYRCELGMSTAVAAAAALVVILGMTEAVKGEGQQENHASKIDNNNGGGEGGQRVWCIAKPSADDRVLLANINYACSQSGVDCGILRPACPCFSPNTMAAHASVAMNLYYQHHGRNFWNCYFNGTGLLIFSDPSYGSCNYISQ